MSAGNRLAGETSPYLLQHAGNPVDWYPWGPEALERARSEAKPIFLSIGYSACHWCHVMERESFEDRRIAELMNRHFVSVKVDREERPDLDEIYMKAVQSLSGSGGWPMSVFLTPDLEPFFGGTYFPPFRAHGRPGFADVLAGVAHLWEKDRERAVRTGRRLAEEIAREGRVDARSELDPGILDRSLEMLRRGFDPVWGGFGDAPKFPHAADVRICLRHHARTGRAEDLVLATASLDGMAAGGIHDQIGGGFHRYSTDERWLVPHFEKMLYDNALLVPAYLEAYLVTGAQRYADVARAACAWALREMRTAEGGFASSQDADSEGEEGRFYTWTPDEMTAVLGARRSRWAQEWYGVGDEGNFEGGRSALWRPDPPDRVAERLRAPLGELTAAMAESAAALFQARERRVRPATDDKVLAAWNGLMISALAQAHQVLGEPGTLDAARAAARHVLGGMRRGDGRLFATARGGRAHLDANLDDYAFVVQGLVDLYESDFDPAWLREALALTEVLEEDFADRERGGYFTTAGGRDGLIARLKNPHDGALPAGNGVHALNLLRLAELTGQGPLARRAERAIVSVGQLANRYPAAFSQMLAAVDFLQASPAEIVIAGEADAAATREMLAVVRGTFLPWRVVALACAGADETLVPLLEGRGAGPGGATAYVCRSYACREPSGDAGALRAALAELRA